MSELKNFFFRFPEVLNGVELSPKELKESQRQQLGYVRVQASEEELRCVASSRNVIKKIRVEACNRIKSIHLLKLVLDLNTTEVDIGDYEIALLAAKRVDDSKFVTNCINRIFYGLYAKPLHYDLLKEALSHVNDIKTLDEFVNFADRHYCSQQLYDILYERALQLP